MVHECQSGSISIQIKDSPSEDALDLQLGLTPAGTWTRTRSSAWRARGRSIESWLAGLNDVHIDLWQSDPEPKPEGPHDRFFVIGLGGNPMTGAG